MKDYVGIEPDDWKGAALFFAKEVSLDKKQDLQGFDAIEWLDFVNDPQKSIVSLALSKKKDLDDQRMIFQFDEKMRDITCFQTFLRKKIDFKEYGNMDFEVIRISEHFYVVINNLAIQCYNIMDVIKIITDCLSEIIKTQAEKIIKNNG